MDLRSSTIDPNSSALAFFDVDGTLTYRSPKAGPTNVPRARVREAVEALVAGGNFAVLCTGRGMEGVGKVLSAMPFRGFVTLDGAYVTLDGQCVVDARFHHDMLRRMVAEMERVGMSCLLSGSGGSLVFSPDGNDAYSGKDSLPRTTSLSEVMGRADSLGLAKVDFWGSDYDRYLQSAYLRESLTYYNVGDGYHELVLPGVSKGSGALALLEVMGHEKGIRPRTFAFGDSENDLSVFDIVDVAVAMGQASEVVRARADYVTGSAAADGVARTCGVGPHIDEVRGRDADEGAEIGSTGVLKRTEHHGVEYV